MEDRQRGRGHSEAVGEDQSHLGNTAESDLATEAPAAHSNTDAVAGFILQLARMLHGALVPLLDIVEADRTDRALIPGWCVHGELASLLFERRGLRWWKAALLSIVTLFLHSFTLIVDLYYENENQLG